MNNNPDIIISTAYLPPVSYFQQVKKYQSITVDIFENYLKQTYRNRCCIYSANGKLPLSIPVKKVEGNHTKIKDVEIDYSKPWQRLHWRAIESAYSNSPFFLYYRDDFEPIFSKEIKHLVDLNHKLLEIVCKHTGIKTKILCSKKYSDPSKEIIDLRNKFSPKKNSEPMQKKYTQVFEDKHGFMEDLSIIDLLFNEGKFAKDYL